MPEYTNISKEVRGTLMDTTSTELIANWLKPYFPEITYENIDISKTPFNNLTLNYKDIPILFERDFVLTINPVKDKHGNYQTTEFKRWIIEDLPALTIKHKRRKLLDTIMNEKRSTNIQ